MAGAGGSERARGESTIVALALLAVLAMPALADTEDPRLAGSIIYSRGDALFKADTKGKGEVELAKLPQKTAVRALRTDAKGTVLLADLGGKWSWMPLDGKATTLTDLPCADGPAQLATDGACVLCRSATDANKSVIINLATNKATLIDVPPPGARLVGDGATRKLVWADASGVWSSPPGAIAKKTKVAPDAPLRGFLPSPDGARAVGVYSDFVHDTVRTTKPAEILMGFALDGQGARRKTVKASLPIEWSFDSQWVLLQDGSTACITRAMGGQYKCWKGFIAASISPDGAYALLLGARDVKPAKKKDSKKKPADEDTESDEPVDDVNVPPPTGPVALYRAKLDGAFAESPARIVQVVEGSAVWIPSH